MATKMRRKNELELISTIESKVVKWIEGKHGMIGIVIPEKKITEVEWKCIHEQIAQIMIN